MTPRIKFFLSAFFVSLPFWWGANVLEKNLNNFFFWQDISNNSKVFAAQAAIEQKARSSKPVLKKDGKILEVDAKAVLSLYMGRDSEEKILFEKNINERLPVASLSKLMTALVVLENYDLSKEIKSKEGQEFFSVEYFLYPLLIQSDNDAAFVLANNYDGMDEEKFVALMNRTAENLGLKKTFFWNSSGLDPDDLKQPAEKINQSTAADLAKLVKTILPQELVWNILSIQKFDLFGPELENTNELLEEIPSVLGGKTGYTERAGGCIILVLKAPNGKGYIINVILGSDNYNSRFEEMKKLTEWLNEVYRW